MNHFLSAGACKGLFQGLYARQLNSGHLRGAFGAVGAMQEKLLNGEPCELLVLTLPLLEKLALEGWVIPSTIKVIGQVGTGIAVASNLAKKVGGIPNVLTSATLKANLLAASQIHFPDPLRSTAGIHFKSLLDDLGIASTLTGRCAHYPNGAFAMAQLAKNASSGGSLQMGCTQVSEILYTPGVELVAELPEPYRLRTTYAAGLTPSGFESDVAHKMLATLTSAGASRLRLAGGFL
jgi:molybdate transport system substrate-binding protein